jgi:hypothetical protein
MVTTVVAPLMSKTRLAPLPLMVNLFAPGASIFRLWEIGRSPDVSVMEWTEWANSMVSPLTALEIAARSDPGPLSAPDVTMTGETLTSSGFQGTLV